MSTYSRIEHSKYRAERTAPASEVTHARQHATILKSPLEAQAVCFSKRNFALVWYSDNKRWVATCYGQQSSMHWRCGMIGPKVLWISSGPNRYQRWESVFDKTDIQVQRVDELNLSMRQIDEADVNVVLADASGIIQDDIDLCRRLRERFDFPLILITPNLTEEFAVAAYNVGIDDCISGHISPALLRAKGGRTNSIFGADSPKPQNPHLCQCFQTPTYTRNWSAVPTPRYVSQFCQAFSSADTIVAIQHLAPSMPCLLHFRDSKCPIFPHN